MPTTSNFGWTTPADTDLVKDGAAAIRTLGNGIDTSFLDLKGGTTDQVLAKNSNSDLDFKWVAQDDSNAIQNAIVDAKGDLISATAADTPARLAVGANDTVLTADSSTSTGLKWAAPAAAVTNWSLLNSGGTALTGAATITISGISGKDKIMLLYKQASSANGASTISVRLNTDTGANYNFYGIQQWLQPFFNEANLTGYNGSAETSIRTARMSGAVTSQTNGGITLSGCNASGVKAFMASGCGSSSGDSSQEMFVVQGYYDSASTISSISLVSSTGNFDNGTVYVYTSAA